MEIPFAWGTKVTEPDATMGRFRQWEPRRRWVPELLADARRFAGRDFMVQSGRRITFAAHEAGVHRIAGALQEAGVAPGARVVLFSGNQPEMVAAFWAILQAGGIVVLANGWWTSGEIAEAVRRTSPAVVLSDRRRAELLPAQVNGLLLESFRPLLEAGPLARTAEPPTPEVPGAQEDDPAVVLFTSGTTGFPKGAVLSHRAVIANIHNLLSIGGNLPQQQRANRPPDASLLAVPLFHISGLQAMLLTMLRGGRLVFRSDSRFDAGEILELVERERIVTLGAVPTMLGRLLEHPDITGRDMSSVRVITTGGMPVPPVLMDRLRDAFPSARKGLGALYGLSESGGALTAIGGPAYLQRPYSSGLPFPVVELRIADPDGDGVGEVLARSPTNMSGYWGLSDDQTVDPTGWLHTGDLGRLEDGHLVIVGRSKDVIIRAGENVAAPHVEACLLEHPDVAEVAVVGLEHPDLGEEVAAAVVLRPAARTTPADLARFAAERLAAFAVPTAWWLRSDPLPTTASGKALKPRLRLEWPDRQPISSEG